MSKPTMPIHSRPASVSTPRVPTDRFQQIWTQLSVADREVILGHSRDELSADDRIRLVRVLRALGRKHRSGK